MKRILVAALLLMPAPVFGQEVLADLQRARVAYPTPMSPAQLSDLLNRVARSHPGWGMLRKDGGFRCPTPSANLWISCDYMVHGPTGWAYDVIQDADGTATPKADGGSALSPGQEIVFPWSVSTEPTQPPTSTAPGAPATRADLQVHEDNIVQRIQNMFDETNATLERMFGCRDGKTPQGENCATAQDNADAIRGVAVKLQEHDEKTNAILAFFKNGKTLTALATLVSTYITLKQTQKEP